MRLWGVVIENTCRYCSLTRPCDFAGYCSKECKTMDHAAIRHAGIGFVSDDRGDWALHGANGENGRTRQLPADLYDDDTEGE